MSNDTIDVVPRLPTLSTPRFPKQNRKPTEQLIETMNLNEKTMLFSYYFVNFLNKNCIIVFFCLLMFLFVLCVCVCVEGGSWFLFWWGYLFNYLVFCFVVDLVLLLFVLSLFLGVLTCIVGGSVYCFVAGIFGCYG